MRSFPGMSDYVLPEGVKGLAGVVVDSVNKCDPDVRKDLYQQTVLTGRVWLVWRTKLCVAWWLTV